MRNHSLLPFLLLSFVQPAELPAQQSTAAEAAYREAWWAESGRGDLAAALKDYVTAAAADGPAAIRAKALLGAGRVQQRLGKTESAIATFRQLLQQHPGEADAVEQARAHLRELTAVDLRQGYDEWYQRRLFSEEVQTQILQKIQALAGKLAARPNGDKEQRAWAAEVQSACSEILAFDDGAVPALRKAAESASDALASRAVELLFELGEVPPAPALQRNHGSWVTSPASWQALLSLPNERAAALLTDVRPGPTATLLCAALQGELELAAAVVGTVDVQLAPEEQAAMREAAASALLRHDGDSRRVILKAIAAEATPLRIREALERVLENEPFDFSVAEWLAIGADPLAYELRFAAIRGATRGLQATDGDALDTILARIAEAPPSARQASAFAFTTTIEDHASPLQIPWTASRLRTALLLQGAEESPLPRFRALMHSATARSMLAEALLGVPLAVLARFPGSSQETAMGPAFLELGGDHEIELRAMRWYPTVAAVATKVWPGFDEAQQVAVLQVLAQIVHPSIGSRAPLLQFLDEADKGASENVRAAIAALRQQWNG